MQSIGPKMTCVVPSRYGVLRWWRTLPLLSGDSRLSDTAGLAPQRFKKDITGQITAFKTPSKGSSTGYKPRFLGRFHLALHSTESFFKNLRVFPKWFYAWIPLQRCVRPALSRRKNAVDRWSISSEKGVEPGIRLTEFRYGNCGQTPFTRSIRCRHDPWTCTTIKPASGSEPAGTESTSTGCQRRWLFRAGGRTSAKVGLRGLYWTSKAPMSQVGIPVPVASTGRMWPMLR